MTGDCEIHRSETSYAENDHEEIGLTEKPDDTSRRRFAP